MRAPLERSKMSTSTTDNVVAKTYVEQLKDQIDWDEFKRKAILQVMHCTSGKNPLDYFLADVAVTCWMENLDKSADEMEAMIKSFSVDPLPPSDNGFLGADAATVPMAAIEEGVADGEEISASTDEQSCELVEQKKDEQP